MGKQVAQYLLMDSWLFWTILDVGVQSLPSKFELKKKERERKREKPEENQVWRKCKQKYEKRGKRKKGAEAGNK